VLGPADRSASRAAVLPDKFSKGLPQTRNRITDFFRGDGTVAEYESASLRRLQAEHGERSPLHAAGGGPLRSLSIVNTGWEPADDVESGIARFQFQ
jgi:hypothetical protein